MEPQFEKMGGLIPAVIQDATSHTVLMVGFMNREAWEQTHATGFVWFWSRSRQTLWKKGDKSGNTLRVVQITLDCDNDAALILASRAGPVCHTGTVSCFDKKTSDT